MKAIREAGPNLKSFYYHVNEVEETLRRGTVVILHGSEGYGGRYEPFAKELEKHGYSVYAIDHIGHGLTVMDVKDNLGNWKKKDFYLSAYNVYYLVDRIKRKNPKKPVYILGDDIGGAMVQYMMGKFNNIFDGVIVASCGTPSGRDFGMLVTSFIKKLFLYDNKQSKGTFRLRTRFYNSHFRPTRTKYDWMNSVPEEVDRFIKDPKAGYACTIGYYFYQYKYTTFIPYIVKLKNVDRKIPLMFIGGGDDCVTHRGRKIEKLKEFYENRGFSNVSFKLYNGARHDVLLDWNKDEVAKDIARWIDENSCEDNVVVETKKVKEEVKEIKSISVQKEEKKETVQKIQNLNEVPFQEEAPEEDLRISSRIKSKVE